MENLCILKNAGHFPIEQPGIAQLEEAVVSFIKKYYRGAHGIKKI